jgi:ankyrin repeat protein
LLLGNGARIDAIDLGGSTPLHFAARWGKREVTALLLASGAAVNAKDFSGHTPLHYAASQNADVEELLRQHGAIL